MTHKKLFKLLTLAAFVALVVIAPLQAAPDCQKKGDTEKKMGKECTMKTEGCMMLKNIPNLSDEQKTKLEKLQAEHQKDMTEAMAAKEKLADEMKALMKEPFDVKKIEAKIDEIAMMKAGMQKKCLAQYLVVRALLTPEQKAKFDEMGCCGMMGEKGCMMGGHKHGEWGKMKHEKKMEHSENEKTEEVKK